MQAEDSVPARYCARRCDGGPHFFARIGNERWKTGSRAIATVSPSYRPHAIRRRLIVEQNAAPAIDLQINETGRQESAALEARLRPIGGNLIPCPEPNDAPVPDHHRGFAEPAVTVKNAVRQHGVFAAD